MTCEYEEEYNKKMAYSFMPLLTGAIMLTNVITHSEGFTKLAENFELSIDGRCCYCRYKRNHPIVRHDDKQGECGWR